MFNIMGFIYSYHIEPFLSFIIMVKGLVIRISDKYSMVSITSINYYLASINGNKFKS